MTPNADFCGDTFNFVMPPREPTTYRRKSMHKLAQQIWNNKSLRAKNRIRKLGRLCAVVAIR
jgi:hypothetical protein